MPIDELSFDSRILRRGLARGWGSAARGSGSGGPVLRNSRLIGYAAWAGRVRTGTLQAWCPEGLSADVCDCGDTRGDRTWFFHQERDAGDVVVSGKSLYKFRWLSDFALVAQQDRAPVS